MKVELSKEDVSIILNILSKVDPTGILLGNLATKFITELKKESDIVQVKKDAPKTT